MDNLLCLCDVWNGLSDINANVSISTIFKNGQFLLEYYFLHHRNLPFEENLLSDNYYFSILNFHSENTKGTTILYIYSIWEERLKAFLKVFLIDWRYWDILKTSFLSMFFKMLLYIVVFSISSMGKHIEENIKNSFFICIKFVERRRKYVWKMSPGDARIMIFYGRLENVNLTL